MIRRVLLVCGIAVTVLSVVSCNSKSSVPVGPVTNGGTISGRVVDGNGAGISGVMITFIFDTQSFTRITDLNGAYEITFGTNGAYMVTPTFDNSSFTPGSRSVNLSGSDVMGVDFTIDPTIIGFEPDVLTIQGVGGTGVVAVMVEKARRLSSAQVSIAFDPALVEVSSIGERGAGYFFTDGGATVITGPGHGWDNTLGVITISIGAAKLGESEPGVSGSGLLASITFSAKTTGSSALSFRTTNPDDLILVNYEPGSSNDLLTGTVATVEGSIVVQ